ncbi:hypothetical protein TURU_082248 [Turdus rufiventris]|nr:hypothetical protein TURU_082248 [Turdus rufiventris]
MKALRRLDAKEHRGKTPLLVAVTARQAAIVHDLIQAGADVNAVDNKGQTALHLAATYGYPQVLQVILSLGFPLDLEMKDFEGHTPLHCAVLAHNSVLREQGSQALPEEQRRELQQQSRELESCIQLLVQTGASIYSRDVKSNKTVLHYTVQDGNVSLLRYFLELNAFKSKDFVNNKAHGNTALHMAAALPGDKNQKEIIQLLLEHGADPSIRNLDNDQPIHMAPPGKAGDQDPEGRESLDGELEPALAGFDLREWKSKPRSAMGGSCKLGLPNLSIVGALEQLHGQAKKRTRCCKNKGMGQGWIYNPIRSDPIQSQPIQSNPIPSNPTQSNSIQSNPIQSHPIPSNPIPSNPIQTNPIHSNPNQSHPIPSNPIQTDPIQSNPIQSNPIPSNPIPSHPIPVPSSGNPSGTD